jgi:hypothetical protein
MGVLDMVHHCDIGVLHMIHHRRMGVLGMVMSSAFLSRHAYRQTIDEHQQT